MAWPRTTPKSGRPKVTIGATLFTVAVCHELRIWYSPLKAAGKPTKRSMHHPCIYMSSLVYHIFLSVLLCTLALPWSGSAQAAVEQQYDLAYAWDKDLDSILDYKEELEELFEPAISQRLKVVQRQDEYGVVFDCNASVTSILKVMVKQGVVLQEAGLDQAFAVEDTGYHELYNVSYGYGPNLEAMKEQYEKIYCYLGKSVGKDLFIEQDEKGKYMLVYRRRGDRASTMTVAKRHGRLLRKKGIQTAISKEFNNPVVYGESSYLHGEQGEQKGGLAERDAYKPKEDRGDSDEQKQASSAVVAGSTLDPVILRPGNKKVAVHKGTARRVVSSVAQAKPAPLPRSGELRAGSSSYIEKKVEGYIKQLRKKGRIRSDEKTGWVVYDLERDVSLVDINADQSFQAASMIKPFVALAFFHQVKQGVIKYGPRSRSKMEAMIQRSSNTATNWVMRQVGGPASCQRLLTRHYPHLFKQLHIVEYIPKGGRTYRNKALPSDYIRFLRALWNKELPYGREIRRLMSLPGRDRLYHGTPIPEGTLVYNKTGTTAHLCGDMGILAPKAKGRNRYPYAIVGIIERSSRPSNYKRWMQSRGGVIRQVSTLVYKDLKKQYALR